MGKSTDRVIFLINKGKEFSEDLKKRATTWELEFKLKLEDIGVSFIFQHPVICNKKHLVILDFYIPDYKLAIEIDGKAHYTPIGKKKDKIRTGCLRREGISVIRIANSSIHLITTTNLISLLKPYAISKH